MEQGERGEGREGGKPQARDRFSSKGNHYHSWPLSVRGGGIFLHDVCFRSCRHEYPVRPRHYTHNTCAGSQDGQMIYDNGMYSTHGSPYELDLTCQRLRPKLGPTHLVVVDLRRSVDVYGLKELLHLGARHVCLLKRAQRRCRVRCLALG